MCGAIYPQIDKLSTAKVETISAGDGEHNQHSAPSFNRARWRNTANTLNDR